MIRFPGSATPARAALSWEAWTSPPRAVRFGGEAVPATVPISWEGPSEDVSPPVAPIEPRRPAVAAPHPAVANAPSRAVHLAPATHAIPEPPSQLLAELAAAQDATARAHATYLALHNRHMATLTDVQQGLARLLERHLPS